MHKPSVSTLLISGLLALMLLGTFSTSASASSRLQTIITFKEMSDIHLGDPIILAGTIVDDYGLPVVNKPILFALDGEYLGQVRSDESGFFQRKFNKELNAGTYVVSAMSNATHFLEISSTSTEIKILPTEVRIQTVPAISGIPFQLDGKRFISGEDGMARIEVDVPGTYRLDVLVDQYHNPSKRIEFARWLEESYEPYKDLQIPTQGVIQVGFDVYHQVGQSFLALDGTTVDPQRISEFTIRSAQGDLFVFQDGQQRWIPASRVARRVTGLEETKLLYSVLNVTVDGSNVVNKSQQRFYASPGETWPISLLLYSMRINAKDGLFGFPVGKSVNIEFPDGRVENHALDNLGRVELHTLARGNYSTELVDSYGLTNRIPVALSRDQEVITKILTYLDLTVVGALGGLIALGLLLYGRPSLLTDLLKKNSTGIRKPKGTFLRKVTEENPVELEETAHMPFETVKAPDRPTPQTTYGLDREMLEQVLANIENGANRIGRPAKLSGSDQILITLHYLRGHDKAYDIGQAFGVSASTVYRTARKVKNVLIKLKAYHLVEKTLGQPANSLTGVVLPEKRRKLYAH
jgi:hypothetical protein